MLTALDERDARIASLLANQFDPEKHVELASLHAAQSELDGLKASVAGKEVDVLVASAIAAGKLAPRQEEVAKRLGRQDRAALESLIETASPIPALAGTQTGGIAPAGGDKGAAEDAVQIASAAQDYQAEQKKHGREITIAQAVNHVRALAKQ